MGYDKVKAALAAMRARRDAARPGPWFALVDPDAGDDDPARACEICDEDGATVVAFDASIPAKSQDVAFIAAARTDLPKLLAIVEAVIVEREAHDEWRASNRSGSYAAEESFVVEDLLAALGEP